MNMGEERVRDILNGLLIEFGWIPWGTFKLAKTQHMNSDIVLAVHKSKKTLFFNLGVISKIINKSEGGIEKREEEEGEIQFIFCKGKYLTNTIAGLLREALAIELDQDILTKLLEFPKQKIVDYIENKNRTSLKLKTMAPGRELLPIHEKWIKVDIYSPLEDNELVVVERDNQKIYGRVHSLESGTAGSISAVYKVIIGNQPIDIISLSILFIYKVFNENEMDMRERENNRLRNELVVCANIQNASNLGRNQNPTMEAAASKDKTKWTAAEKKEEIRKMWEEFKQKGFTEQEKNQFIKRIKLNIHPDKNLGNAEAAEEVFKWFPNFLEGKENGNNLHGNGGFYANYTYNSNRNNRNSRRNQRPYNYANFYSSGFYYKEESAEIKRQRANNLKKGEEVKLRLEMKLLEESVKMVEQVPELDYSVNY